MGRKPSIPKQGIKPKAGSSRLGRGKVQHIDYTALDALLQFKVTKAYCADYLDMSEDTLERRLREDHDMTFQEYAALRVEKTGVILQKKAIEAAMSGQPALMIFALKNLAGWSDKVENSQQSEIKIHIDSDDTSL